MEKPPLESLPDPPVDADTQKHPTPTLAGDPLPKSRDETLKQFGELTDAKRSLLNELISNLFKQCEGNALLVTEMAEHLTGEWFSRSMATQLSLSPMEYARFLTGNLNLRIQIATQRMESIFTQMALENQSADASGVVPEEGAPAPIPGVVE